MRALEERLPQTERNLRGHLSAGEHALSQAVGQGTLLARVGALERAMDAVMRAQEAAMDAQEEEAVRRGGCCRCCTVM